MSCVDKLINKGWTERQAGKHLCGGEKEDGQEGVRDGWNGEDEATCRPWVPCDSHAFCAVDFFFFLR